MLPLTKFAPLAYLMGMKLSDLTMDDFKKIADVVGINVPVTEELKSAGLALLQGRDIDSVADMIKDPESIAQIVNLVQGRGLVPSVAEMEVSEMYVQSKDVVVQQSSPVLVSHSATGWRLN